MEQAEKMVMKQLGHMLIFEKKKSDDNNKITMILWNVEVI